MERLAQEQRKAIEDRDIESLENIIKERQELIEAIEALNRKLRPLKEEIVEALGLRALLLRVSFRKLRVLEPKNWTRFWGELARF